MDRDQYSLNNLRDIVVPDPPPFWPPAPGAWVALAILTIVVLLVVWRLRAARNRNAYRRAGLVLMRSAISKHDVSVILKRVALAVFPREKVASLHGVDWVAFLNRTCSRSNFSEIGATDSSVKASQGLIELGTTWIRHHNVPNRHVPNHHVPGRNVPNQNVPSRNAPSRTENVET